MHGFLPFREQSAALVASALSVVTLTICVTFVPAITKKPHVVTEQQKRTSILNIKYLTLEQWTLQCPKKNEIANILFG